MATENRECALRDYLDEIGIEGHCWLGDDDASVRQILATRFPGNSIHVGHSISADALEQCSLLIISSDRSLSTDVILPRLAAVSTRPLIILLGELELTGSDTDILQAMGYILPSKPHESRAFHVIEHAEMAHKKYFDVARYWERRYASGQGSGAGSYGRLALFKAHFINHFVHQHNIDSVLELGCGDGAQLSLAEYPKYIGLDVSETVVDRCRKIFAFDATKQFELYDPKEFRPETMRAELGLSLDVIYHLSNDELYHAYLDHLFAVSSRFVIIYSNSDRESLHGINQSATYIRFRNFLDDIREWEPNWSLVSATPNRFPYSAVNPSNTSLADFYLFEKRDKGKRNFLSAAAQERFLTEKILNSLLISDENTKSIADNVATSSKKINTVARDVIAAQEKIDVAVNNIKKLDKSERKRAADSSSEVRKKIDEVVSAFRELDVSRERSRIEDASAIHSRIDALLEGVERINAATEIQIRESKQRFIQEKEKIKLEHIKEIEELRARIERVSAEKLSINKKYEEVIKKYRAANSKYRNACQQITALKAEKTSKGESGKRTTPRSIAKVAKIPLRTFRRNSIDKTAKRRAGLLQVLRHFKWNTIVPIAVRLGLPREKIAAIRFPQVVRTAVRRADHNTGAAPRLRSAATKTANLTAQPPEAGTFAPPSLAAQEISILGWPAPRDGNKPLVLAVMDEFSENCFGSDLRLLQPRPDNWYALAKKYRPELVFIESAWKGNGSSWQYRVGTYSVKPGEELGQVTAWARQEGIASVFWNKEDPVHHEKFLEAAALADHIFTTDENMVASYRKRTGNPSVHALPFAAQPSLHKPASISERLRKSCFAGSWYGNRHAERGEAISWLLKAAHRQGLDIFDRNYSTGIFPFPKEYQNSIRGSLHYLDLCKQYPRYRLFLNVNSVTDSPTMFSRRVFELMACGTPVVSTYASGIEELFESDAVWLVRNEREAEEAIHTLLNDYHEWRRRSLAGIREIFSRHTYAHRLNSVFEIIGLTERVPTEPKLLLCAHANHRVELERLLSFANKQHYKQFRLLVETAPDTTIGQIPEQVELIESGSLLRHIAENGIGECGGAGWISPNHTYGAYYLQDLANAIIYQPDASGWAKALGEDAFAFGAQSRLTASIWRPDVFRERWLTADDQVVVGSALYAIDADEFTASED